MNLFYKMFCRIFQLCFKIALPVLPYRDPKILDSLKEISVVLKNNKLNNVMIVTDKTINRLGLIEPLIANLNENNIKYSIYDDVVANPTTDNVYEALKIYQNNKCQAIISFGGGSPMDCAKALGALVVKPNADLNKLKGILKVRKKIPTLIAIPTTAGTGSETTLAAVIVDSKTRHKYAINDFPLIPKYAVLDPSVTLSLPKNIVATTGMDALTHAIEAYIGRSGNKNTRKDASDAFKLIFDNLKGSYDGNNIEEKKNMLVASHLAGRAFSKAYVGYVHAIAHSLGGKYNIPHGLANAIILPYVLKEYGKCIHKDLYKLGLNANLFDKDVSIAFGAKIVINKIEEMNEYFHIPKYIKEIQKDDIDELVCYALKEANPLYPVPKLWDRKQMKKMYYLIGDVNE